MSPPPSVTRVDAPLPGSEPELPGQGESEVFVGGEADDERDADTTDVSSSKEPPSS